MPHAGTHHELRFQGQPSSNTLAYGFVIEGTASDLNDPTTDLDQAVLSAGDRYDVISGFVRGGSDAWEFDGRVVDGFLGNDPTNTVTVTLDGSPVGTAAEVINATGGGGGGGGGDQQNGQESDDGGISPALLLGAGVVLSRFLGN